MDRRDIIKSLSALPLAGAMYPVESAFASPSQRRSAAAAPTQNIYQTIGVEPVINCRGTFTIIGGSIERPEVVDAMHKASGFFVQYDELAFGIGQRLADLTGAEWGMVSAGCAAGMKHVTAACVTGGNPEKLVRIPDLRGFEKTEVISPRRSRNVYDHALRNIGVTIITVDTPEEMERAIGPRTAMLYLMANNEVPADGPFSLEQLARMAKPLNIPILVDAAAEDLTVPNVHLQRGATVVAYSGGKAICGPQCAGLLLGKKDILLSAWQASSPHHGCGRDNKVGKEEMMGMLAAVEAWIKRDHVEKEKTWHTWLENISKRLSSINGVTCTITEPRGLSNRSPRLSVTWDPEAFNIKGTDISEEVATTKPRIALGGTYLDNNGNTGVSINSGQMQPGNDKIVADRLYEILTRKNEKPKGMSAPAVETTGRWDVDIEFYSSKSRHSFNIEQDGNFITGSHRGDFTTRDMYGIVDGNEIKLFSSERQVADNVPFTFHGTATNDKMEGGIYMGEYIRAKFTATRYKQAPSPTNRPITVPQGQPLSS
ncbi:MAG: hypothetical protein LBV26_09010 [Bacteroidales bacterium]|jgi:uncharacterized pyridoxal phosphate-dependent enzyme|nr:hypothetical protein [Bacteroidales bacterium]